MKIHKVGAELFDAALQTDEACRFSQFCERAERELRWWGYCEFDKFCSPELYMPCDTSSTACCKCNNHRVLTHRRLMSYIYIYIYIWSTHS